VLLEYLTHAIYPHVNCVNKSRKQGEKYKERESEREGKGRGSERDGDFLDGIPRCL
jgi:hypothetical protein